QSISTIGKSGNGWQRRTHLAVRPNHVQHGADAGADRNGLDEEYRQRCEGLGAGRGIGVLQRYRAETAQVAVLAPQQPQLFDATEDLGRLAKPLAIGAEQLAACRLCGMAESQGDAPNADPERDRCGDGDDRAYEYQQCHEEYGND